MHTKNQTAAQTETKLLKRWSYVVGIVDEFEDCTYTTAIVYSYMLCKYVWFRTLKQDYFETQEQIATSSRIALRSTKTAIKWLTAKGFLKIKKNGRGLSCNNVYEVVDKYDCYTDIQKPKATKEAPKPSPKLLDDRPAWMLDDDDVPPF